VPDFEVSVQIDENNQSKPKSCKKHETRIHIRNKKENSV